MKPGILIGSTTARRTSRFGIRGEVGSPVTIDVHEKFSVVTGGFVPVTWFINANQGDLGWIPLLVRLGIEIDTPKNLAPYGSSSTSAPASPSAAATRMYVRLANRRGHDLLG